jgi:hypothetical protein
LAKHLKNVIVIPKESFYEGNVYIEKEGRLQFKKVTIVDQTDTSYIVEGLNSEDKLIISDIVPAVEGLKVKGL